MQINKTGIALAIVSLVLVSTLLISVYEEEPKEEPHELVEYTDLYYELGEDPQKIYVKDSKGGFIEYAE